MVKGLGYSDHAYEAAKARLDQKYGGNRPQVQAYIDELRKMRPINADKRAGKIHRHSGEDCGFFKAK